MMRRIILSLWLSGMILSGCGPGASDISFRIVEDYYFTDFSGRQKYITRGEWGEILVEGMVISFTEDGESLFVVRELNDDNQNDGIYSNEDLCEIYRIDLREDKVELVAFQKYKKIFQDYPDLMEPVVINPSIPYKCLSIWK